MFVAIFFLILSYPTNGWAQQSELSPRIHFGERSEEPYVLYFEQNDGMTSASCTASLIRSQYILTAAHCFHSALPKKTVIYGCYDLRNRKCKEIKVVAWKVHPDFRSIGKKTVNKPLFDIALAKLATPLRITPIELPSGWKKTWKPSGVAYLVGYGNTEKGEPNYYQLSTHLPIMQVNPYGESKEKIMVKIMKSRTDLGDSGGPLIINNTLYGVLSGGSTNPKTMKMDTLVYMSVNHFRNFIDSSIKKLEKTS